MKNAKSGGSIKKYPTTKLRYLGISTMFRQCNLELEMPETLREKHFMLFMTEYADKFKNNALWDIL